MQYGLTYSTFGAEEKEAILKVVDSDRFTMGKNVEEFERQFAEYFGMKHAVMVNSGSSADLLGIASLFYRKNSPLKPGDEVIVPNISWATTYYPLYQYGLKLKFVDIDLNTLNIDVSELKKAITRNTKMIVAVSILGNPCDLVEISKICKEKNIILFEDNCESMGANIDGKYTGTFGLINTFSTFFSHHISTMEGGLILTDDEELYNLSKSLRSHGWTRGVSDTCGLYGKMSDDFFEAYRFILPGYNVRPGELHGAVGKEQLKKLKNYLKIRRENAEYFRDVFDKDERFILQKENGESSWFCFTMIVNPKSGISREDVLKKLRGAEIEHRIITGGCMPRHEVIKYFNHEITKTTNADIAHFNGFFVGNYPIDIRDKIDYLHKTLKED